MIRRLRRLFGQPELAVLVFLLGVLAFNWPILEISRAAGDATFFFYLFAAWAGAILLAFLISRSVQDRKPDQGGDA